MSSTPLDPANTDILMTALSDRLNRDALTNLLRDLVRTIDEGYGREGARLNGELALLRRDIMAPLDEIKRAQAQDRAALDRLGRHFDGYLAAAQARGVTTAQAPASPPLVVVPPAALPPAAVAPANIPGSPPKVPERTPGFQILHGPQGIIGAVVTQADLREVRYDAEQTETDGELRYRFNAAGAPPQASFSFGLRRRVVEMQVLGQRLFLNRYDGVFVSESRGDAQAKAAAQQPTPAPALTALAITPVTASVPSGAAQQFTVVGSYSDGSTRPLTREATWAVLAKDFVSDGPGLVRLKGPGLTTTVQATCGGQTATATLTVVEPVPTALRVNPDGLKLAKGTGRGLTAIAALSDGSTRDVTNAAAWSTSDRAIVSAGLEAQMQPGQIVCVAPGQATIRASFGGQAGTVTVAVIDAAVTAITITPDAPRLAQGTTLPLAAVARCADGTSRDVSSSVRWSTQDPAAVTITPAGLARGEGQGRSAVITATYEDKVATVTVAVQDAALVSLSINPPILKLIRGVAAPVRVSATYSDGSVRDIPSDVTWQTSNADVAPVPTKGMVTGARPGQAALTATLADKTAMAAVMVA